MNSPVFLIGVEPADTYVLQEMLAGHPQVAWPGDFDFALSWPAAGTDGFRERMAYWHAIAGSPEARKHRLYIRADLDIPSLARSFLDQLAGRDRKPVFGVTTHTHFARILALWPEARFIQLLRDGGDLGSAAPTLRHQSCAWNALSAAVPARRRIEVRYESLIRDAERELNRVCEFLGIAPAPELLVSQLRAQSSGRHHAAPRPKARIARRFRLAGLAHLVELRLQRIDVPRQ